MVRTKVCGITSENDLQIAINGGADAVGFLVGQKHNAKGFISPELAQELCKKTAPFVSTVVVTHYKSFKDLMKLIKAVNSSTIQIHSDVKLTVLKKIVEQAISQNIICKVSVTDRTSIQRAVELEEYADGILLDTIDLKNNRVGGTGLTHNWDISAEIVKTIKKPVILAGGLNYLNVVDAIKIVNPWAVDANSGLTINNKKDFKLVNAFVRNAKKLTL